MTALEKQLRDTFHRARWNGGKPSCPRCFDGLDVRPGYLTSHQRHGVARWFCACCKYPFTDATGTPIEKTARPLALWAYLAMGGDPRLLRPRGRAHRWKMRQFVLMKYRMEESHVIRAWVAALREQDLTPERLRGVLAKTDSALYGKGGAT